jgi:hypothetical protein
MGNAGTSGAAAALGVQSRVRRSTYLCLSVATALGFLALGVPPVAADGTTACAVGAWTTWQPSGGRLVLSIGGCAYQVTSAVDPYVITVTGPAAYSDTIYRGDGTAPTSNVVLDSLAAGTYTITSSGVVSRQPDGSPLYGWSWSSIQVDPASVEIGPTPAPVAYPVPPPFVIPTLRVTKVTPGAGSRGTWRSVQPRVTFSTQPFYSRDITITLTDTATGRLVPIRKTYCMLTLTTTIYPVSRLAANRGYRITVTSASANLNFRATFRTGSQ